MDTVGGQPALSAAAQPVWLWWVLWFGLAAISVALVVLLRTRWGQSQPLRKCVVLSLLVHVLLACYATTVHIVETQIGPSRDPAMLVSLVDGLDTPAPKLDEAAAARQPWDAFASPVPDEPLDPLERAESPVDPFERATATEAELLLDEVPLPEASALESAAPEPAALAADVPIEHRPATAAAAPDTAAPQRADDRSDADDSLPDLERPTVADSLPEPAAATPREPAPSLLEGQPAPLPQLRDLAATQRPESAIDALDDLLTRPAETAAADLSTAAPAAPLEPIRRPAAAADEMQSVDRSGPASAADAADAAVDVATQNADQPASGGDEPTGQSPRLVAAPLVDIYKNRFDEDRARLVERFGGSAQTEAAVNAALQWLAANQDSDGRWHAARFGSGQEPRIAGHDRGHAGAQADTGLTGLALLAFLGAGHTHVEGQYQETVRRGLEYLRQQQAANGHLAGSATTYAHMYCHGMATFALSEAYSMTRDTQLTDPVRRAIGYTLSAQHPSTGGWRYRPGDLGDTSQLGWQLMALKSAELAGVAVPEKARLGMVRYLRSVASGRHGGLASYRPGEAASRTMTAEALASRQFLGMARENPASNEGGDFLLGELPGQAPANHYYWYYATLAMYQLQGAHWQQWNAALQEALVNAQVQEGALAGSWEPDPIWGSYGGRVYSTALAALCLEVYYRYLPLYGAASHVAREPAGDTR